MIKLAVVMLFLTISTTLRAEDFAFSKTINNDKVKIIKEDLEYLKNFEFQNTYPRSFEAYETPEFTGGVIYEWINKRVNYFVDNKILSRINVLLFESLYRSGFSMEYPDQRVIPYSLNPKNQSSRNSLSNLTFQENLFFDLIFNEDAIMTNLGASLYLKGKFEQKIYYAKFSSQRFKKNHSIEINSPRVGLLKIGKGFFGKSVLVNKKDLKLAENRISRLSILAHEARHSDGQGESLSFAHAKCPATHNLYGKLACDESLNGPYTIGAQLALEMLKNEKSINITEKEILKVMILDNFSRVLPQTNNGKSLDYWESAPESLQK